MLEYKVQNWKRIQKFRSMHVGVFVPRKSKIFLFLRGRKYENDIFSIRSMYYTKARGLNLGLKIPKSATKKKKL